MSPRAPERHSLQRQMPWLVTALAASAAAMSLAASFDARFVALLAAFAFSAAVMAVAVPMNADAVREPDRDGRAAFHTLRRNTRLIALVYAWGAAALFAIYLLTDVKWRHGWQYGTAMAAVAALLLGYVHALGQPGSRWATDRALRMAGALARLHGLAAGCGLAFLVGTGKLATLKGDWAANHVFLVGGLTIVVLAFMAANTHRRLLGLPDRD